MGDDIRINRPRIFYLWEKAKGGSSTTYGYLAIHIPLFYIERIYTCHCWYYFSGATLFCENMKLDQRQVAVEIFILFCEDIAVERNLYKLLTAVQINQNLFV